MFCYHSIELWNCKVDISASAIVIFGSIVLLFDLWTSLTRHPLAALVA